MPCDTEVKKNKQTTKRHTKYVITKRSEDPIALPISNWRTCVKIVGQVRKPPPRFRVADGGGKRKEKDASFGSNNGEKLRRRKKKK